MKERHRLRTGVWTPRYPGSDEAATCRTGHRHMLVTMAGALAIWASFSADVAWGQEGDRYERLESEVEALRQEVQKAGEHVRLSVSHLAGYAAVGYTDSERADGTFSEVLFAPIFHYLYDDLMMLESELEIAIEPNGETEVTLEYLALDLFLHDYLVLVAGKFLSPIGQFRQNLHPAWVNKLPSAPPGFGHDGAAPLAEVGLQARGGFPLGSRARGNYALYVGNGPELESGGGEVHGIVSEGFTRDVDGNKVVGGRLGWLPVPSLELGLSAATGKAAVTEDEALGAVADDPERDYDVAGADLTFHWRGLDLRGEYVQQEIGDASGSPLAPEGGKWEAWYVQAAYVIPATRWELVLRRADFDSPHPDRNQEQWTGGVNYLFAANVIAKAAYEANDGLSGAETDRDRVLLQLAYGF